MIGTPAPVRVVMIPRDLFLRVESHPSGCAFLPTARRIGQQFEIAMDPEVHTMIKRMGLGDPVEGLRLLLDS